MATYYIDTAGTDNAGRNGGVGQEWLTLAYACTRVTTSGDIIHINAGTYDESVQSVLSVGVSIEGAGVTSIITSSTIVAEWTAIISATSVSVVDGAQEIRNLKFDGNSLTASQAINIQARSNIKIHDCTFVDFHWFAVTWKGIGGGEDISEVPDAYITGSEFYYNTVTNCAGWDATYYRGALFLGCQDGMLIHHNTMVENRGTTHGWPIKFWYWGGWSKGVKIYNNYLERSVSDTFDFAIEALHTFGMEVYDNEIIGSVDLNNNYKTGYSYAAHIHDNTLGRDAIGATNLTGVTLEFETDTVIIERNHFRNCGAPILFTPRTDLVQNIDIRYNVFENVSNIAGMWGGIRFVGGNGFSISHFNVHNNVFDGSTDDDPYWCIVIDSDSGNSYTADHIEIINNIFTNFGQAYILLSDGDGISYLNIENNVVYNCGASNLPDITGSPSNYTIANNILADNPDFVSATDFRLQTTSPAKDAGKNISLTTDFLGYTVPYNTIPDIGAYEFGSSTGTGGIMYVGVSGAWRRSPLYLNSSGLTKRPAYRGVGGVWELMKTN